MYNVVISFGNYPTNIKFGEPGPYTAEELGLMWLKHCATFSQPGMLAKYRLVLLLPKDVTIAEDMNVFLDAWGDKKRFNENSNVRDWPLGPNLVFQQLLWFYIHKRLEGPFLWCEPDCIPVRPRWLDDLFEEYVKSGKAFMGALVDAKSEKGQRIPRHMTGNGIYPDKAHVAAPGLLEARQTPWDVWAANQIMRNCWFTKQIQHEYRHEEIMSMAHFEKTVSPAASLFHTDKFGAIIRLLGSDRFTPAEHHEQFNPDNSMQPLGKTLVEVFAEAEQQMTEEQPSVDMLLDLILRACQNNKETQRKVAYFMLENGIVNQGYLGHHMKKKAQQRKKEPLAYVAPEPAA